MRIRYYILAFFCAALPASVVAQERRAQVFKPAGPWAMEYADEGCRLIRNFSDGSSQLTVAFERFSLEPSLRLGLTTWGLQGFRTGNDIEFRYEGQAEQRKAALLRSVLADGRKAYLLPAAPMVPPGAAPKTTNWAPSMRELAERLKADIEAASHISGLTLLKGFQNSVSIDLGSMAAPMKAMQSCASDLVSGWGIDVPRLFEQSRPVTPIGSPLSWITPDDYPPAKMFASVDGLVDARLIVEPDGSISKCMVDVIKRGDFEQTVCDNLSRRAHFQPALDGDGKPMRSYWIGTWRFTMPD